jgi:hypothetical protein
MNAVLLTSRKFTVGAGLLANALGQTLQQWRPNRFASKPAPSGPSTASGRVDFAA